MQDGLQFEMLEVRQRGMQQVCEKYVEVPECPSSRGAVRGNRCRSRIARMQASLLVLRRGRGKRGGRMGEGGGPPRRRLLARGARGNGRRGEAADEEGQSLSHIWQTHGSRFPVGARTFYATSISDPRHLQPRAPKKVKYKPRRRRKKDEVPFRHSLRQDMRGLPEARLRRPDVCRRNGLRGVGQRLGQGHPHTPVQALLLSDKW